jgi:large subunit ribosomal protein L22
MPGPKLNEAPVKARVGAKRGTGEVNVKATAKFVRTSPYKMRVVLDLVRGHKVAEAADILRLSERDAAITIGKILRSAVANAQENEDIPADELYVSACYADEGPTIKRFRPRARGRTGKILKRTSHITVVVSRLPDELLTQARERSAAVVAQRAARTAASRASAEQAASSSRRATSGVGEEVVAGVSATATAATASAAADGVDVEELDPTQSNQLLAESLETTDNVQSTGPQPLFTAPTGEPDALNKIIGIGPKLATELNELGITQFAQLAELSDEDLAKLDAAIPRSAEQIADWRTQAQEILAGTWNRDSANNT